MECGYFHKPESLEQSYGYRYYYPQPSYFLTTKLAIKVEGTEFSVKAFIYGILQLLVPEAENDWAKEVKTV